MRKLTLAICLITSLTSFAQNQNFNFNFNIDSHQKTKSIIVSGNHLNINTRVIYNALPDGYHVTYTYTAMSNSVKDLELLSDQKLRKVQADIKKMKLKKSDIILDVKSLDPIFNFNQDTAYLPKPKAFKSTYNITFNIKDISDVDPLSRICLENEIYDMVNIVPYIKNVDFIQDSLANKSVAVLNKKKQLAKEIGYVIEDGKPTFEKVKTTLYPSERYLKSYIKNNSLFKHNMSQNSTIIYNRQVDADNFYNLDLHKSDFIFNSNQIKPVIQFIYDIHYGFLKRDREAEAEEKEQLKREEMRKKDIYILDKNGRMKKVSF